MLQHGIAFLLRGGWIMWPLFVCALVSVTVMIERLLVLGRAARGGHDTAHRVQTLLLDGKADEAQQTAQTANNPIGRVLAAGIRSRSRSVTQIDQAMQAAAMKELPRLNRRLGVLDTIITLSPLLGLLGTITGMIQSFQVVATASGASAAPAITGGVAEALIATATGLAIAIATLPVYNALNERVRDFTGELELYATQTQAILSEMKSGNVVETTHAPAT